MEETEELYVSLALMVGEQEKTTGWVHVGKGPTIQVCQILKENIWVKTFVFSTCKKTLKRNKLKT